MGKVLQIRVTSWTYDEDEVLETWPRLADLAWPRSRLPGEKRGVLELVTALQNGLEFEDWPPDAARRLAPGIAGIVSLKQRLEEALGNWDPRLANRCSDELEDALDELERKAPTA